MIRKYIESYASSFTVLQLWHYTQTHNLYIRSRMHTQIKTLFKPLSAVGFIDGILYSPQTIHFPTYILTFLSSVSKIHFKWSTSKFLLCALSNLLRKLMTSVRSSSSSVEAGRTCRNLQYKRSLSSIGLMFMSKGHYWKYQVQLTWYKVLTHKQMNWALHRKC